MTGLLVNRTYFGSEDLLPDVGDSEAVVELIVSNENSSNLNVYKDSEEVGSIRITPRQLDDGGAQIVLSAVGKMSLVGLGEMDAVWRGELDLLANRDVSRFELWVSFREPKLKIFFEFDPETYEIGFRVKKDGEVVADSADEDSKIAKRVKALLFPLGLTPGALKRKEARGQSLAPRDAMRVQFGKVTIAGVRQTVYMVTLSPTRSRSLKFYISETGELLKVGDEKGEPIMGSYSILSEGYQFPPDEK